MNNCITPTLATVAVCFCLDGMALAQTTGFTYQGQLNDGANPASGFYDLTFALYDTSQPPGNLISGPLTNSATAISNGLFTTMIDFGAGVFTGTNYWLEIGVQTNGASGFTRLTPRQPLTPAPYALTAGSVVSGGLAAGTYANALTLDNADNSIAGVFSGDGSGLDNVNAYSLNGLTSASFWQIGGNAGANPTNGAFFGTTDNLPLEFKVNGSRALRLEYTYDFATSSAVPNIIGGYSGNVISNGVVGGFIGGGGTATYQNQVGGNYASVLGGLLDTASGYASTAMGYATTASGYASTAMGYGPIASGSASTAMGAITTASGSFSTAMGNHTTATGDFSTAMGYFTTASSSSSIAMGYGTTASADGSTAMGEYTTASGFASTAMGYGTYAHGYASTAMGENARSDYDNSFVWSDGANSASTAINQFVVHAAGGLQLFGGGLAVNGASSPNYGGDQGLFIENQGTYGSIYAFDYTSYGKALPLCLNSPGGNVGIGTTSPDAALTVYGAADKPGGGSWSTYSDARLKDVGANFTPSLAALAKIQPVYYHYKTDNALKLPSQPGYIGVIAQQIQQALPDAVQTNSAGYLTVNNDPVLWTTINAVKEVNQKLETENAALKARLDRLEQLLEQKTK